MPSVRKTAPGPKDSARKLIYLPIIHTPADLGSLGEAAAQADLRRWGRLGSRRKVAAIERTWTMIEELIENLKLTYDKVRLYQDGLPVCGREAEMVAELAQGGSRNHQLLLRLMAKGAHLMGTESAELLVQEFAFAKESLTTSRPSRRPGARRATLGAELLAKRDQFIARRINETLKEGETGILFLGMLHSLQKYLNQDIQVIYPRPGARGFQRKP